MKKIFIIFCLGLVNIAGICQDRSDTIKVSKDLELVSLTENSYLHISYANIPEYGRVAANGLIFINKKKAFLFDTPWTDSLTMTLVTYLKQKMGLKVIGFVPNHWHEDCLGGLGYIKSKEIASYANQRTIDIAREKSLPVADHGFIDSIRLNFEGKLIKCYYFGAAHTLDNIVVWIPSENILFPGCMVKSINSTSLGNIADGDLKAYPGTIDRLIQKFSTAKIVVPGHGKPGGPELLFHTRDLLGK
jgi:metallo-beta-lactamase class B